jgi:diazepam-binding inhibitor (GABA receptor modulating acyl-CoA-binding protein)
MENSSQFINATLVVKKLNSTPSNEQLCSLYGLYKQATIGNNTTTKPSMFDLKANSKWNAWMSCKDLSTYDAEVKYITLVNQLIKSN